MHHRYPPFGRVSIIFPPDPSEELGSLKGRKVRIRPCIVGKDAIIELPLVLHHIQAKALYILIAVVPSAPCYSPFIRQANLIVQGRRSKGSLRIGHLWCCIGTFFVIC